MVQIKVMDSFPNRQFHFRAGDVVFISINNCPNRFFTYRPTAGKYPKMKHRGKWFPVLTDEQRSNAAFDCRYATSSFAIPRRDSIPDAPYILPTLPANAVEKCELQVVGLVAVPTIRDIDHVPGFEPFVAIHSGSKLEFVLAPG